MIAFAGGFLAYCWSGIPGPYHTEAWCWVVFAAFIAIEAVIDSLKEAKS